MYKSLSINEYNTIKKITKDKIELKNLSDNEKNNYSIVLEAVANNPNTLQYASEKLKKDYSLNYIKDRRFGWSVVYYMAQSEPVIV